MFIKIVFDLVKFLQITQHCISSYALKFSPSSICHFVGKSRRRMKKKIFWNLKPIQVVSPTVWIGEIYDESQNPFLGKNLLFHLAFCQKGIFPDTFKEKKTILWNHGRIVYNVQVEKYNPPPDKAPNCRTCLHRWGKPLSRNKSVRKNILSIGNFLIQRFRVFPYLWSRDKSVGGVGAFVNRRDVFEGSWRGSCGVELVCVPVTRDRRRKGSLSGRENETQQSRIFDLFSYSKQFALQWHRRVFLDHLEHDQPDYVNLFRIVWKVSKLSSKLLLYI